MEKSTDTTAKWEDSPRQDLRMIPAMEAAGWTTRFFDCDRRNGRTTPDNPPVVGVSFRKQHMNVWSTTFGWQVAENVTGYMEKHRGGLFGCKSNRYNKGYIPDLKTVLELDEKGQL